MITRLTYEMFKDEMYWVYVNMILGVQTDEVDLFYCRFESDWDLRDYINEEWNGVGTIKWFTY